MENWVKRSRLNYSHAKRTLRGFLWLNPIAMYVVNCNRAEVVECSRLKPCWSGAGRRYLLMVEKIRVSMTFAARQRSEIGVFARLRYRDEY